MVLKSELYYWLECDKCGEKSTEGGDYGAWVDSGAAYDEAINADWVIDKDHGEICYSCACALKLFDDDDERAEA